MKFLSSLLLAMLLPAAQLVFSQNLSIEDLIQKQRCKDIACFNSFISQKGFVKDSAEMNTDSASVTHYYISKKEVSAKSKEGTPIVENNIASFTLSKGTGNIATFKTVSRDLYLTLMAEITDLEFKSVESEKGDASQTVARYKSRSYKGITLVVRTHKMSKIEDGKRVSWNLYSFSVY